MTRSECLPRAQWASSLISPGRFLLWGVAVIVKVSEEVELMNMLFQLSRNGSSH